ncbi:MAG: fumarylacetoacetate hydrolase family protein [Rhodospirillaceae bacterium]|nr:fumarylacetoacetate hydrolase family protein [Rhodospirillaceae bacterium]MBT6138061.1 fumarylacetoacetate hydrolase family protein [Rhodospirillaceae bacterium]
MKYAIPAWDLTSIPVASSDEVFPVRRVYCVGRNYAAHAREMGHDPDREPPFFFMKPADAIVPNGSTIPYPVATSDLHHEIEMVVALKSGGSDIAIENANECIFGYGVGLDLTRRDLQGEAKKLGRPWDMGKGFDRSAPCSPLHPVSETGIIDAADIWLKVNGETRQTSNLNALIWSVPETISYLSGLVELAAGDLIYSGTPAGVAAIERGDVLEGHVDGLTDLKITIA